jgi:hypothetical protein
MNDIYWQRISLVSEAKNQGNNTLKCKVSILTTQHFIKKLLILFSTLKFFDVVIVLTNFWVSSLEKRVFKKVA